MVNRSSTVRESSGSVAALFQQAIAFQRSGQFAAAETLYRRILRVQPRHAGALHLLGMAMLQFGDLKSARRLLEKSVAANPDRAEPHADLGSALHSLGFPEEALASYDRALALKPDLIAALYNRAIVLQEMLRDALALESLDRVISLQPDFAGAQYNRALVLTQLGRREEAIRSYERALQIAPDYVEALSNRGSLLLELKRPEEALESFDRALRIDRNSARTWTNRGNALRNLNRLAECIDSFDHALRIEPEQFEALRNRGGALKGAGILEAALENFDAALRKRPDCPLTLLDRAEVLLQLSRHQEAADCLQALLRSAPDAEYAIGLSLHVQRLRCDWTDIGRRTSTLIGAVRSGLRADYPFLFLAATDSSAAQQLCARAFAVDKFAAAEPALWHGETYRHDRIRLAYVSGDFRSHAVANLMAGVFEKHDVARFETTAISFRPVEDSDTGRRVRSAFSQFLDVSDWSDRRVAERMREMEIDIAVDLVGFTHGCRTSIFARRPARVQVNYLGFPGTMGTSYVDYIIADSFVIPAGREQHYEPVCRLPECFQANDDRRPKPARMVTRKQLSLPDDAVVFCCFNNTYKLNPVCFETWMRILAAVPGSVLWLLAETAVVGQNLRGAAARLGVDPVRLVFAARVPYLEHLTRLQAADLFLDTLPFNGGTTVSDALWVGLPVLTCAGEAFASRMAGSLLRAVGLSELVTHSVDDYVAKAVRLALSPHDMNALRQQLGRNLPTAPLFDTDRFRRHLEAGYTAMLERSDRALSPTSFSVAAI